MMLDMIAGLSPSDRLGVLILVVVALALIYAFDKEPK